MDNPETIRIAPGSTDTLLIVFSHRDADDMAFYRVTDHLPVSRLFVRDPSLRGWYNGGIPGLGANIASIADALRVRIEEGGFSRVLTLGSSMGGYAALLFGALLRAESVLAFCPQTVLDRVFPLSPPLDRSIEEADLLPIMAAQPDTVYNIVIGEDDAVDLWHLSHVAHLHNSRAFTVFGSSHLLTDEMSRRGELRPLLQSWVNGLPFDVCDPLDDLLRSKGTADAIRGGVYSFMRRNYSAAVDDLDVCCRAYPRHPGLWLFLGESALEVERYDLAITALRLALGLRGHWSHLEPMLKRALQARAAGDTTQALPARSPTLHVKPISVSGDRAVATQASDVESSARGGGTMKSGAKIRQFFRDVVAMPGHVRQATQKNSNVTVYVAPPIVNVPAPPTSDYNPWREIFGERALLRSLGERAMARTASIVETQMAQAVVFQEHAAFLRHCLGKAPPTGAHCEFGVYSGHTINVLAEARPEQTFDGFDSFRGLPSEWTGWTAFDFDRQGAIPDVRPNVKLHVGLFDETIPGYADAIEAIAFLHVDCDLYESTVTIFEKLGSKLMPKCVIVFDEYFGYPGFEQHEMRAFGEFLAASGRQPHWFACCGQRAACILD